MRGDRLRFLRENANLSQEDLANRIGMGEAQIWRYEKGKSQPSGDVLVKLSEFFNVSTDFLLGTSDHPTLVVVSGLTPLESQVIAAWRNGKHSEAAIAILNDENAAKAH